MLLFHREIIFVSRYSSFSIFNYPMICDVMMGISTRGRVHFSVSLQKELGNIDYSGLKNVLFICKLENYKKDPLLIIFGGHFLGTHVDDRYHFGSGCDTVF